jgi:hypothetical protein
MRFLGYLLVLVLGLAAGVASVAVHRSVLGLALAAVATVMAIRASRWWLPRAGTLFAAGWLVPFLMAVGGRGEGDYAVSSDLRGWLLVGLGFVVFVTGLASGRVPPAAHDSGYQGAAT